MECEHQWEPAAVVDEPGRVCHKCREFEQITKRHFKELFKQSFWKWQKSYDDLHVWGGYKGRMFVPRPPRNWK